MWKLKALLRDLFFFCYKTRIFGIYKKKSLFDHLHPYIDIVFNLLKIDFFMSLFIFLKIVCFFVKKLFNINQGFF